MKSRIDGSGRLGVIFRPQSPPEELLSAARTAEAVGIDEMWLWEDCFLQGGLTSAAAALASTSELTVGLGLMPAPLRNVAAAAMEIANLERLFPGRFRIAVGHGVQEWMGQVGGRVESPLTLMREYVTALRGLLAGDRVTMAGRYVSLDAVQLDWPPTVPPRVLVGAVGPKSLALAGELADGVLLDAGLDADGVRDGVEACLRARAGADVTAPFEVVQYMRAFRGADAVEQLALESQSGGSAAGVANSPELMARRAVELWEAGADAVILMPSATERSAGEYFRFVADEVRPWLDSDSVAHSDPRNEGAHQ